jgi:hypothetical protein
MHGHFWSGFFTTLAFIVGVAVTLGVLFLVVSLIAGTPGS